MRARKKHWIVNVCTFTTCISLLGALPAYAGMWGQESNLQASGWVLDETTWYFLSESGEIQSNQWILHTNGLWYYVGESGAMMRDSWIAGKDGAWYYVGSDGAMLTSAVTPDGYTVGDDGAWITSVPRKRLRSNPSHKSGGGSGGGSVTRSQKKDSAVEKETNSNSGKIKEPALPEKEEDGDIVVPTASPSDAQEEDDTEILNQYIAMGLLLNSDDQSLVEDYMNPIIARREGKAVLIGNGFFPYSEKLNGGYYPVEDAGLQTKTLHAGGNTYHVVIYELRYTHEHAYHEIVTPASCTEDGLRQEICEECGDSKDTVISKLGHTDTNGDSVCDRCGAAMGELSIGSVLTVETGLSGRYHSMEFICLDDAYQGGYLFLAKDVIPYGTAPGYGTTGDYTDSRLRRWLNDSFYEGLSIAPRIQKADLTESTDVVADYVFCLSRDEVLEYSASAMDSWTEEAGTGSFWTRTSDEMMGAYVYAVTAQGHLASIPAKDRNSGVRPAFILGEADKEEESGRFYMEGDTQERELAGQSYVFRCVDPDYADAGGNPVGALFLCDEVIGADICRFGEPGMNSWAESTLRSWLNDNLANRTDLAPADTSIRASYSGKTSAYGQSLSLGRFTKEITEKEPSEDEIFCLSLEEAIRYQDYLWRLRGSGDDNFIHTGTYTSGYWLRTPYTYNIGMAYAVTSEGEITAVDVENESVGFRPAYVVKQK